MDDLRSEARLSHPRPDFFREHWQSLDGDWEFAFDDEDRGLHERWETAKRPYPMTIRVPFVYQSSKSGIGDNAYHPILWYRRRFTLREALRGGRVLLRFGAVDESCRVYVNGAMVSVHSGGYTPFAVDITPYLLPEENEVALRVADSRDTAQPRGKQYWEDGLMGCWYMPSSGIWQSVYLEKTGEIAVESVFVTPDIDHCRAQVELVLDRDVKNEYSCEYELRFEGRLVRKIESLLPYKRYELSLDMRDANRVDSVRLWSPEHPALYDLYVRILKNGEVIDEMATYFGMRKVETAKGNVLLNHSPVYQRLVLDQGYWPDTLLTPPDNAALRKDVEMIKAFGFNGVRKHQKIEDPRFYYWCDRLGLFCWGELPSAYEYGFDTVKKQSRELQRFIERDYNHPSIITWVPLNESWGVREIYHHPRQQSYSMMLYYLCKALDGTRCVSGNDGWEQTLTDISALHDYAGTGEDLAKHFHSREWVEEHFAGWRMSYADGFAPRGGEAFMITEYGGIAMAMKGYQGKMENMETWGYHDKVADEHDFIERYCSLTDAIRALPYCRGYCYTQLTDVMQEVNGLMTPDRTPKIAPETIAQYNINPDGY